MAEYAVAGAGITKSFAGTQALRSVDVHLHAGEVHALVGENGSGKSTLLRVLAGVLRPDRGTVRIAGEVVDLHRPKDATSHGVVLVTQEGAIAPNLTVAENIFLGRRRRRGMAVDWRGMRADAAELLERLEVAIDPAAIAGALPPDQRQLVEIARALSYDAKVVLLDEPTSSLDFHEVEVLLRVMRNLAAAGIAIGFVSHRLAEMRAVSDRFTVLRDGVVTGTRVSADVDDSWLVRTMVGRELHEVTPCRPPVASEPVLVADRVSDSSGILDTVSLQVGPGEIVGLSGLVGAGKTELLETLAGRRHRSAGRVVIGGGELGTGVRSALRHGIVLLADDRQAKAIVPNLSVHDNAALALPEPGRSGRFWRRRSAERDQTHPWMDRLEVRCASTAQPITTLSGGNQQKVILSRSLAVAPRIVLLDEPTRGVDLGAKQLIYDAIVELAANGLGVVVASSELPELLALCHRIVVLREGRVVTEVARADATEELLITYATGAQHDVAA